MKSKTAPLFVLGVLFISGYVLWSTHQRTILVRELESFIIPAADIDSTPTKELRLYRYLIETRLEPSFAIPGTDTELLRSALGALKKSQDAYLKTFDEHDRTLILNSVYPLDFLHSLADTEDTRRLFIETPTIENARTYHNHLMRTAQLYQKNADELAQLVRTFDKKTIGFWQGTTNATFVAQTLQELDSTVRGRLKEERRRFRCFSYGITCRSLENLSWESSKNPRAALSASYTLPPAIARNMYVIDARANRPSQTLTQWGETWQARSAYALDEAEGTTSVATLPVILLQNSWCSIGGEPAHVRFWWSTSRASGIPTIRIAILDDLYFRKIDNAQSSLEQALKAKGVSYIFQPTSPFVCIDFEHDTATALSAFYIQSELIKHPIFEGVSDTESDATIKTLAKLERAIRTSEKILDSAAIAEYMTHLRSLFSQKDERAIADFIGDVNVLRSENIITTWLAKSAWLEYRVGYLDDENVTTRLLVTFRDLTVEELVLIRSYISSLYQLTNETVAAQARSLIESQQTFDLESLGIVSFNDTLSREYSPEEMVQYILSSDTAVNALKE